MAIKDSDKIGSAYVEVRTDMKRYNRELFTMRKNTKAAVKKIQAQFGKMTSFMGGKIAGLGSAFLGFAAIMKGFNKFREFDQGMRNVNTILNVTQKELDGLGKGLQAIQREVGVGGKDITNALYQAASAGVAAGDSLEFVRTAAKAATAGIASTETAVDGLTTVINAWGMDTKDAGKVADVMFKTVKLGKTTFDQFASSLSIVAGLAAASGVKFEEIAAATATLTTQGVPTSVAMTQIRAALIAMNKELGDGWSATMTLQEGMGEMAKRAGGSLNVLKEMTGRIEGANGILMTTGVNAKKAADHLNEMNNSAGEMGAAFDEQSKAVGKKIDQMMAKIETASVKLIGFLTPAIEWMAESIGWIADNFSEGLDKIMGSAAKWRKQMREQNKGGWADVFSGYSKSELEKEIDIIKKEIADAPASFGGFLHNILGITTEDTKKEIERIDQLKDQLAGLKIALANVGKVPTPEILGGDGKTTPTGGGGKTGMAVRQTSPLIGKGFGKLETKGVEKPAVKTLEDVNEETDEMINKQMTLGRVAESSAQMAVTAWTSQIRVFKDADNIAKSFLNNLVSIGLQQAALAAIGSFADGGSGILGFIGGLFAKDGGNFTGGRKFAGGGNSVTPNGHPADTYPIFTKSRETVEVQNRSQQVQSQKILNSINGSIKNLGASMEAFENLELKTDVNIDGLTFTAEVVNKAQKRLNKEASFNV